MSVTSAEDFRAHIGLSGSSDAAASQRILDAAESIVANLVGPLSATTCTTTVSAACTTLVLPHARVIAVTDPVGATVDQSSGIATYTAGFSAGQVVTYSAGFQTLPPDLVLAVWELGRHLWSASQRGGGPRTAPSAPAMGGYLLPNAVEAALSPYMALGFA